MKRDRWASRGALALLLGLGGASARADIVRITSINGEYDAAHADRIDVKPGDVVQLSADLFRDNGDGTWSSLERPVEEFLWSADDVIGDDCAAADGATCLGATNFESNDYGVSFYVPYDFAGETITIRVLSTTTQADGDQLVLNNQGYTAAMIYVPTEVQTDPATYRDATFDPHVSLAGQGRWVIIDGVRYFVPYTYTPNWVPYRNGYWAWTGDEDGDGDGWTWVSYDAWGWMTDHYGGWRHHGVYGWLWLPFEGDEFRYHHHWATWFDDGHDRIGWYPYREGWHDGYRHGREQGFDDGYWAGYDAGRQYGRDGLVGGFTVIYGRDLNRPNYREHRLGDDASLAAWRAGYAHHYYGNYPGVGRAKDVRTSRAWVEGGYHVAVTETRTEHRVVGGRELRYPVRVHPMPAGDAHPPYEAQGSRRRPFPVGAVFRQGAPTGAGRATYTAPTADGRGLAHAPRSFDPETRTYAPLSARTARPVERNPRNPIYRPVPPANPPPAARPVPHSATRPTTRPAVAPVATPAPGPEGMVPSASRIHSRATFSPRRAAAACARPRRGRTRW